MIVRKSRQWFPYFCSICNMKTRRLGTQPFIASDKFQMTCQRVSRRPSTIKLCPPLFNHSTTKSLAYSLMHVQPSLTSLRMLRKTLCSHTYKSSHKSSAIWLKMESLSRKRTQQLHWLQLLSRSEMRSTNTLMRRSNSCLTDLVNSVLQSTSSSEDRSSKQLQLSARPSESKLSPR